MKSEETKEIAVRRALDISTDIRSIINEIIDNGGEVTDGQVERLNSLQMEMTDKFQSLCHVRLNVDEDIEHWKRIKAVADEHIKADEKAKKWISDYMAFNMKNADIKSIKRKDAIFSISLVAGKPKVVVDDVDALDFGYFEVVRKPIAKAIKESLDKGEDVQGAHLEMGEDYVMIRMGKGEKASEGNTED